MVSVFSVTSSVVKLQITSESQVNGVQQYLAEGMRRGWPGISLLARSGPITLRS